MRKIVNRSLSVAAAVVAVATVLLLVVTRLIMGA